MYTPPMRNRRETDAKLTALFCWRVLADFYYTTDTGRVVVRRYTAPNTHTLS
jgi:hypothetical protein